MNNNIFTNPKETKYIIKKIDDYDDLKCDVLHDFFASQISNNEQYLAYGGEQEKLNIYDIKLDKIIKYIKVRYKILVCQFTFDSSLLFVGCQYGYVYGYDVQNKFTIIFKQKLEDHVYYIVTIKNQYLITVSRDKTITKTDIKRKRQIFKNNGSSLFFTYQMRMEDYIDAIDYNQIDDIIIIGYLQTLYLWDCKNRRSFIKYKKSRNNWLKVDFKQYSHGSQITQLQLINNNQYLLSLDVQSNLYKWKIDYIMNDLIKIKETKVPWEILSFYFVNQDQNLLMICQGYLEIINNQGETIYKLDHQFKFYDCFYDNRQLENLRYIIIRQKGCIQLAYQQN